MTLSKEEKQKRLLKRKQLLNKAQQLEKRDYENQELTFNMDSKEDYYRIIDSKKY